MLVPSSRTQGDATNTCWSVSSPAPLWTATSTSARRTPSTVAASGTAAACSTRRSSACARSCRWSSTRGRPLAPGNEGEQPLRQDRPDPYDSRMIFVSTSTAPVYRATTVRDRVRLPHRGQCLRRRHARVLRRGAARVPDDAGRLARLTGGRDVGFPRSVGHQGLRQLFQAMAGRMDVYRLLSVQPELRRGIQSPCQPHGQFRTD